MGFFRQEYWSGLPFPSPRNISGALAKKKEKKSNTGALVFFKKFQANFDMLNGFFKVITDFSIKCNFGDTEFYNFSVDQSLYNGIK